MCCPSAPSVARKFNGTTQRLFPTPVGADALIRPSKVGFSANPMAIHNPRRGARCAPAEWAMPIPYAFIQIYIVLCE